MLIALSIIAFLVWMLALAVDFTAGGYIHLLAAFAVLALLVGISTECES